MNELVMRRIAAVCMSVTTLMVPFALFASRELVATLFAPWWVPVSVILVAVPAIALLSAAVVGDGRWIGPGAMALGAANAAVVLLVFVAWEGEAAPPWLGSPPIWPANTVVLPAIVMATVYRIRVPIIYTTVILVPLATAQQLVKVGELGSLGYANALLTGALVGVVLTVELAVMDTVRAADRRREEVLAASARTASRAARIAERDRLDVVVRDEVIAVLRDMRPGVPDRRQRGKAAQALADLTGSAFPEPVPDHLSATQAVLRLREAVNEFGDDTFVDIELGDTEARYPYPLCEALVDAVAEAVANVVQHAGSDASRAILGVFDDDLIRLRIVDDGVGFDPRRVPADRAGIELGIRRRMTDQPGGAAWVDSTIGEGAMVSLEWSRR